MHVVAVREEYQLWGAVNGLDGALKGELGFPDLSIFQVKEEGWGICEVFWLVVVEKQASLSEGTENLVVFLVLQDKEDWSLVWYGLSECEGILVLII